MKKGKAILKTSLILAVIVGLAAITFVWAEGEEDLIVGDDSAGELGADVGAGGGIILGPIPSPSPTLTYYSIEDTDGKNYFDWGHGSIFWSFLSTPQCTNNVVCTVYDMCGFDDQAGFYKDVAEYYKSAGITSCSAFMSSPDCDSAFSYAFEDCNSLCISNGYQYGGYCQPVNEYDIEIPPVHTGQYQTFWSEEAGKYITVEVIYGGCKCNSAYPGTVKNTDSYMHDLLFGWHGDYFTSGCSLFWSTSSTCGVTPPASPTGIQPDECVGGKLIEYSYPTSGSNCGQFTEDQLLQEEIDCDDACEKEYGDFWKGDCETETITCGGQQKSSGYCSCYRSNFIDTDGGLDYNVAGGVKEYTGADECECSDLVNQNSFVDHCVDTYHLVEAYTIDSSGVCGQGECCTEPHFADPVDCRTVCEWGGSCDVDIIGRGYCSCT